VRLHDFVDVFFVDVFFEESGGVGLFGGSRAEPGAICGFAEDGGGGFGVYLVAVLGVTFFFDSRWASWKSRWR
jgi:hypothetical protein